MFCHKCGAENTENSRFCVKCGTELASLPIEQTEASEPVVDNAVSPVIPQPEAEVAEVSEPVEPAQAATPSTTETQPLSEQSIPVPEQTAPPPGYAVPSPEQAATPAQSPPPPPPPQEGDFEEPVSPATPIIQDTLEVIKKFFSQSPNEAVAISAKKDTHIWSILGGAYTLLLAIMLVTLVRGLFGSAFGIFGLSLPLGRIFFQGILIGAFSFAAYGFGVKLLFAITKVDISIPRALNLAAGALFPMLLGFVAAMIFGFASVTIALGFIVIASTAASILLYIEIQQNMSQPCCHPLWLFLGLTSAHLLVIYIVGSILDINLLNLLF